MKKGFTLVETLITLFIFTVVIVMGSYGLSVSYATGSPNSIEQKKINRDLQSISEMIRYKILTANSVSNIGGGEVAYGFVVWRNYELDYPSQGYSPDSRMIMTASKNIPDICSYMLYEKLTSAIYLLQTNCSNPNSVKRIDFNNNEISSPDVKITAFDISNDENSYASATDTIPRFTLKITATDKKGQNATTTQNMYILDYEVAEGMR